MDKHSKVRVAMLIDCYKGSFLGGGQTHVRELVNVLENSDKCEVRIFSQPNSGTLSRMLWNVWVVPLILGEHRRKPFHILHAQAFTPGLIGKALSMLLKIPVIYSVHGCHTLDTVGLRLQAKDWKYYLEKLLLTQIRYDAVISDSKHFLNYPNINKDIQVIENGISSNTDAEQIRQVTGASKNKSNMVNMLFVGRLETVKGVEYLLHAIHNLPNNERVCLRIVGDGSLKDQLKYMATGLGLEGSVEFLGSKVGEALEGEYRRADLFVLPSVAEGQPIVVLDAWIHKLPVLATRAGHNPWMIEDSKDGFLAEVADTDSLTETLQKAIANKSKWLQMGEEGYKKVSNKYSWEIAGEKTYKLYRTLLHI